MGNRRAVCVEKSGGGGGAGKQPRSLDHSYYHVHCLPNRPIFEGTSENRSEKGYVRKAAKNDRGQYKVIWLF